MENKYYKNYYNSLTKYEKDKLLNRQKKIFWIILSFYAAICSYVSFLIVMSTLPLFFSLFVVAFILSSVYFSYLSYKEALNNKETL